MHRSLILVSALLCSLTTSGYASEKLWNEDFAITEFETCYQNTATQELAETCAYISSCIDGARGNSTTRGMAKCASKANDLWDQKLNLEYNTLLSLLKDYSGDNVYQSLVVSQKGWKHFKEVECEYQRQSSDARGSLSAVIYKSCLSRLTAKRAQQFKARIQTFMSKGYDVP